MPLSANEEFNIGNFRIREMYFEVKDATTEGHAHNFPHVTYVTRGSLLFEELDGPMGNVVKSNVKTARDGKNFMLIKAHVYHRITALEDNCMGHCIYLHRDADGKVSEEYQGCEDSYC